MARVSKNQIKKYIDTDDVNNIKKLTETEVNQQSKNGTAFKKGATPLHYAIEHRKKDIVAAILSIKGINLNLQDKDGCSALHYSTTYIKDKTTYEIFELVFNKYNSTNSDIDMKDGKGFTPLSLAVQTLHKMNKGIKVNTNTSDKQDLKNLFVYKAVDSILDQSVDTTVVCFAGKPISHVIGELGDNDLILKSCNNAQMDKNARDKNNKTILDLVAENEDNPELETSITSELARRGFKASMHADKLLNMSIDHQNPDLTHACVNNSDKDVKRKAMVNNFKKRKEQILNHRIKVIGYMVVGLIAALSLSYVLLPLINSVFVTKYYTYITAFSAIFGGMVGCVFANIRLPEKVTEEEITLDLGNPETSSQVSRDRADSNCSVYSFSSSAFDNEVQTTLKQVETTR